MHADHSTCHPEHRFTVRCAVHDDAGNLISCGEQPFSFTPGKNETIAGIEQAVASRRAGDKLRFICAPEDAYGPHRPELVFETLRENLPPGLDLTPGAMLSPGGSNGRFHLKVVELTELGARLDGNHPLAGVTLHFDLEVIAVSAN